MLAARFCLVTNGDKQGMIAIFYCNACPSHAEGWEKFEAATQVDQACLCISVILASGSSMNRSPVHDSAWQPCSTPLYCRLYCR